MRVTILGCGGSDGLPRIGGPYGAGDWGVCDPDEPRNRRTRSSIHIETNGLGLLVDTSPDLRQQLLANRIGRVDAILYTHVHADHCHGINEVRRLTALSDRKPMPVYGSPETLSDITTRFAYIFESRSGSPYRPVAEAHEISGLFAVHGVDVAAFEQDHGFGQVTTGYRIGPMAYSTDLVRLDDEAFDALRGIDLWIVDCLQEAPHPTHANLELVLSWLERVDPKRAVLTHMSHDLDYRTLLQKCPAGVEPGYDGLTVDL